MAVMESSLQVDVERTLQRLRDVTTMPDDGSAKTSVSALATSETAPCRAWNHAHFMERVASFGVASWFAKPLSISPLACARYGWRNTQFDILQCTNCSSVLCMKIDARLSPAGAEAVAARFASQLEDAHEETCPWRHNASPASFTMMPMMGPAQVAQTLQQRITKSVSAAKSSAHLHRVLRTAMVKEHSINKVMERAGIASTQELVDLVQMALGIEDLETSIVLLATLLAVGGWDLSTEKSSTADQIDLSCAFCNRHLSLVTREPVAASSRVSEHAEESRDDLLEPSAKRRKLTPVESSAFDPISAHRWFCPWLVAQRRRDADGDRLRALETLQGNPRPETPTLTEFVKLPGWIQHAQALKLLDTSTKPAPLVKRDPRESVAFVQTVLALAD